MAALAPMKIEGRCHCGNLSYVLHWPDEGAGMTVRSCGCTFCTKHAGAWVSHRDAELVASIRDEAMLSRYRFGTGTADFYVCSGCGAVPFVISEIEGQLYAVVNANTFEGIDPSSLAHATANFDGEDADNRLARRKRNWIRDVRISSADD